MSRFEKIFSFISDIDVKTTILQNVVYLVAILFITFATGQYWLKWKISCFLAIMALLFVILAILRHFYNINTEFTIFSQSCFLLFLLILAQCKYHDYKVNKSFFEGLAYGKNLPYGLLYYQQSDKFYFEVDYSKHKFTINFFEVFDDKLETKDILCLIKLIDKKTKREEIMLASFEETLAIFGEVRYKNTTCYNLLLEKAECLANIRNDKFYKKIIDKIKDFKKRVEKI